VDLCRRQRWCGENDDVLLARGTTSEGSRVGTPHVRLLDALPAFVPPADPLPFSSSTDPAHNLSDAFSQKFGKEASKVNGFTNLYAMEIDPSASMQDMVESGESRPLCALTKLLLMVLSTGDDSGMNGMMQDLAFAIPGIDEAMGFAEVMK
jgi:hypothetical protein